MNKKPKLSVNCTNEDIQMVILIKQGLKEIKEYNPNETVITVDKLIIN